MSSRSLRQSFAWWCFANRGVPDETLLAEAARIGYQGVDFLDEALWPMAARHGLTLAAVAGHGSIEKGMNDPAEAPRIEAELRASIAKAAQWKIPVLVCFSGNRNEAATDEIGLNHCADLLNRVAPLAKEEGVVLAMELLNSKIDHSGYQCDHTAWGTALCRRVGSPAFRLLYDIYHMQIMEGDIIRTLGQEASHIAHYHTAGNPGRGEPDASQELHYPPIYRAIAATGFSGFIAHEFIPSGDPLAALARVYRACEEALAA